MENVLRETKIPLTHIEIQTASPLCGVFSSSELGLLHKHPTLAYFCAYAVNTSLCDLDVKVLLMQKKKYYHPVKKSLKDRISALVKRMLSVSCLLLVISLKQHILNIIKLSLMLKVVTFNNVSTQMARFSACNTQDYGKICCYSMSYVIRQ